ncbi:MAG: 3',5'-cyclic-AMP phosphodiesterase [Oscillatoriales cyanobacterium C42_A2020_001]|nr:3',5'-cyclic-AMP phosphodiesterase [Leptolyngbyaceae cyanobacterium C42_A2020_001]
MREPSLLVAQITDIHLFAESDKRLLGLQTLESFQTVLYQVKDLERQPNLLLLTGDLSQDGSAESYQTLQAMVQPLGIPTYWVPGNHDDPAVMAQVLKRSPVSDQKSFRAGGWRFLLLDSCVPGCVYGSISSASLEWLDAELSQFRDEPTLITFHHPPFLVGCDWMNDIGLQNANELFAICDRHPQIKVVLFGHIHQEFYRQRNGVHYLGTPSTCIQFKPNSSSFSLDEEQPGLRLVNLFPDGSWESAVQRTLYVCEPDLTAAGY